MGGRCSTIPDEKVLQTVQTVCEYRVVSSRATTKARTRDTILKAAEQLIAEKGFPSLTLDEVAAGAAVSKGGLLHHFPSKQALLTGLAERIVAEHDEEIQQYIAQDPRVPGAFTRAFLRAHLSCGDECSQVCATLTTECRNIPAMLELFRQYAAQCQHRLENDGIDPIVATVIRYTAEGLMWSTMSGMPRLANFDAMIAYLMQLAGDSGPANA